MSSMSAPRRSVRIASMSAGAGASNDASNDASMTDNSTMTDEPAMCPPAPTKELVSLLERKMSLMKELETAAFQTTSTIRYMRDNLKARASYEESTAEAIVWLTRLSWAVQDCLEYKMRQLFINCDDAVMDSIPTVIQHFHKLMENAELMNERFRQHVVVSRELVVEVCSFGITIKDAFYHI